MKPLADSRRLAYLQAMGIDVWRIRRESYAGAAANNEPIKNSVAAPSIRASTSDDAAPLTSVTAEAPNAAVAASQAVVAAESSVSTADGPDRSAQAPQALQAPTETVSAPIQADNLAAAATSTPPETLDRRQGEQPTRPVPTLASLASAASSCTRCALHSRRQNSVFGDGSEDADWMFIGEAPGAEEDRRGLPFVGPAGQLLNAMLVAIGIARENVYIANLVKCRPPQNRDPRPEELVACQDYLHGQLAVVRPKVIVALGRFAAQSLVGSNESIGRLRGQSHHFKATGTPVVATYHPAYLLRSPGQKGKTWRDLLRARSIVSSED